MVSFLFKCVQRNPTIRGATKKEIELCEGERSTNSNNQTPNYPTKVITEVMEITNLLPSVICGVDDDEYHPVGGGTALFSACRLVNVTSGCGDCKLPMVDSCTEDSVRQEEDGDNDSADPSTMILGWMIGVSSLAAMAGIAAVSYPDFRVSLNI
ncbi:hypothetical protein ScPMuIL_002540 [Solemya velum]